MAYENFTDKVIEDFFSNNKISLTSEFFDKFDKHLKLSDDKLNEYINNLQGQNKKNFEEIHMNKNLYKEKLDHVTCLFNNYELRVDSINQHYSNRLGYINNLSKELCEFNNFSTNIIFAEKVLDYIKILSTTMESIPKIFTTPNEILSEGIEIFYALKSLYDTLSKESSLFIKNFKTIEVKINENIVKSIKEFYESNDYDKLELLFKITEKSSSESLMELYCDHIIDYSTISFKAKAIKSKKFTADILPDLEKSLKEIHSLIEKEMEIQFGAVTSKMYLIFPESKQKLVISIMFNKLISQLLEIRNHLTINLKEEPEVIIKLIEILIPISKDFENKVSVILSYPKVDLKTKFYEENKIFYSMINSNYMYNEELYYKNRIIKPLVDDNHKKLNEYSLSYTANKKKFNDSIPDQQKLLCILQEDLINIITSINISYLCKESESIIKRMNSILSETEMRDQVETFIKSLVTAIKSMISYFVEKMEFIMSEINRLNEKLIDSHFFCFTRLNLYRNEFNEIFTKHMRSTFKQIGFINQVETLINKTDIAISQRISDLFKEIQNIINKTLMLILGKINVKSLYNISKKKDKPTLSPSFQELVLKLNDLITDEVNSWPDEYKNSIFDTVTELLCKKLKDFFINGVITEYGAKLMKVDYESIFSFTDKRMNKYCSNKIYFLLSLTDLYLFPKETVESLVEDLIGNKELVIDKDLIKQVMNKRNNLKF